MQVWNKESLPFVFLTLINFQPILGRPRPPPPPRKTSLDSSAQVEAFAKTSTNQPRPNNVEMNFSNRSLASSKTEGDTSSLSSTCSSSARPSRPPPPRRTPSNSGSSQGLGCPRTNAALYANLGKSGLQVRASLYSRLGKFLMEDKD